MVPKYESRADLKTIAIRSLVLGASVGAASFVVGMVGVVLIWFGDPVGQVGGVMLWPAAIANQLLGLRMNNAFWVIGFTFWTLVVGFVTFSIGWLLQPPRRARTRSEKARERHW